MLRIVRPIPWIFLVAFALLPAASFAQFSASVQGTVEDPTGAVVSGVEIKLSSTGTNFSQAVKSDESGGFHFVSLAPGPYEIAASASGFTPYKVNVTLTTFQTLNVPITLSLASAASSVVVTGQPPVLDTAETRNQQTIESKELESVPLFNQNLTSVISLAPGVTGTGTSTLSSSAANNYNWGVQISAQANGQSVQANMWVLDGIDITDNIRPGDIDILSSPDSIQETTTAVNTYSTEYSRGSSILMTMTSKSGSNQFHGSVTNYYDYEGLWAKTEFQPNGAGTFHGNNGTAAIGGPISQKHQLYFFFSLGVLRSANSSSGATSVPDPAFINWADATFPNTVGTGILKNYPAKGVYTGATQTALQAFGAANCGGATPGTSIPCNTPVVDNLSYSVTIPDNGQMYSGRIDKNWANDRLYGMFTHMTNTGLCQFCNNLAFPQFNSNTGNLTWTGHGTYTHTFNSNTLNEASFAYSFLQGQQGTGANFTVPTISTTGISAAYGDGWGAGTYLQNEFHWREAFTHITGKHTLKFGYDGWHGTDYAYFSKVGQYPNFSFDSLLDLVQDQAAFESGLVYNGVSGSPAPYNYGYATTIGGVFVQDTWQMKPNLTLNYGLRWDDFGNPYASLSGTQLNNFILGAGATFDQQVTNGGIEARSNVLRRPIWNVWSPRLGVAWDPSRKGTWSVRAGFGMFHDMPTLGNLENGIRNNPPAFATPGFFPGGAGASPIFSLGSSPTIPSFPYPNFVGSAPDSHGGYPGAFVGASGVDPHLTAPTNFNYSVTVEHQLPLHLVASLGYAGVYGYNLINGYAQTSQTSYGLQVNNFTGDLIQCLCTTPTYLNQSFGSITYEKNGANSRYNALIADLRGRWSKGLTFDASYTHSQAKDNSGVYPTDSNLSQYMALSNWDTPNRFTGILHYDVPGKIADHEFVSRFTNGWGVNIIAVAQSGTPFTVINNARFCPSAYQELIALDTPYPANCGDYNADGNNYDFPSATSYQQSTSRRSRLTGGVFTAGQFVAPATLPSEGNEKLNAFREPSFWNTDFSLTKQNQITERVGLQLRFEFLNIFNHVNLLNIQNNMSGGGFGLATGQANPRHIQLGLRLNF